MLHETILLTVPGGPEPARLVSYVPDSFPELGFRPRPALIVCPGGGDARVRLRLIEAVSALTGLGADRISVCAGG